MEICASVKYICMFKCSSIALKHLHKAKLLFGLHKDTTKCCNYLEHTKFTESTSVSHNHIKVGKSIITCLCFLLTKKG